jgi:hypothetical protein
MAGIYNVEVEQGTTFYIKLTWKDSLGVVVNLSGYTAQWQIRVGSILLNLLSTGTNPAIIITPASGVIELNLTPTQTMTFTRSGNYDLNLTGPSGIVTRLLEGSITSSLEVTS